jgi:hypothetical protein
VNVARALGPNTIEGAPCRPIETGDGRSRVSENSMFDTSVLGEGSRRPANPTVPFPRPRVFQPNKSSNPSDTSASGYAGFGNSPPSGAEETPADFGRSSWHGTTTRTIRFVLTSPNHKPQRVAAALVCAAAALVIFAIGRSPIAGTAGIDQATESLSADRASKPVRPVGLADPPARSELAVASGSDRISNAMGELPAPSSSAPARPREPAPLEPDELAPGLVDPAHESAGPTPSVSDSSSPDAAAPNATANKSPRPRAPVKSSVKKPPPASLPTPARKNSTELDFGI